MNTDEPAAERTGEENFGKRGGLLKGMALGAGLGLLIAGLVCFFLFREPAGDFAGARGATLDPRLYLPVGAEERDFAVLSINVKEVAKAGLVQTFLNDPVVRRDENLFPQGLTLADMEEVLMVAVGDFETRPQLLIFFRTAGDHPVMDFSTPENPLVSVKNVAGYDIFATQSQAKSDGEKVVKMGKGLFLMTSLPLENLPAYLTAAGKRTPAAMPAEVEAMRKKVGGGAAVLYGKVTVLSGRSAQTMADTPAIFALRLDGGAAGALQSDDATASKYESQVRSGMAAIGSDKLRVEMTRDGGKLEGTVAADVLAAGGPLDQWLKDTAERRLETANRLESAGHLRAIVASAILGADTHTNLLPESVAKLVVNGLNPKLLVDRRSGTAPLVLSAADLQEKDWHMLAAQVAAHCDYWYFGAGVKDDSDPAIIIACEKPAGKRGGINVAFADAKVLFVTADRIADVFDRNNALRRGQGIREIAMRGALPAEP